MIRQLIADALICAIEQSRDAGMLELSVIPDFTVDRPANPEFGDFSINLAMMLAGQTKLPPRQVAQQILDLLQLPEGILARAEVAGPGFINLFLQPEWMYEVVKYILQQGAEYGKVDVGKGRSVLVEFVSADPNGPLAIPHGRGAIIGDVLSNLLQAANFQVTREYYINDAATQSQLLRLGENLLARYRKLHGENIEVSTEDKLLDEIARKIAKEDGDIYLSMSADSSVPLFAKKGSAAILHGQQALLQAMGVEFDSWFSEEKLTDNGAVESVLQELERRGESFMADGAIWLNSTKYGDEANRPLVRSNGKPTYLANDVTYHRNKFERGFDLLLDIWGPDHQGYIARTKAALAALGFSPDNIHVLVFQMVRLLRNGTLDTTGKKTGGMITLSELLQQMGSDALRFAMLANSINEELVVDVDLAARKTMDNPLYSLKHAYARMVKLLAQAKEQGIELTAGQIADLRPLQHECEVGLMRRLADLPEVVAEAAEHYEPCLLANYARDLALDVHRYYEHSSVLRGGISLEERNARLLLVCAAKLTLDNLFTILGISAEK